MGGRHCKARQEGSPRHLKDDVTALSQNTVIGRRQNPLHGHKQEQGLKAQLGKAPKWGTLFTGVSGQNFRLGHVGAS